MTINSRASRDVIRIASIKGRGDSFPSNWLSSAVVEVRAVEEAKTEAVPDCIPAKVLSSASAIFATVTASSLISDVSTALALIFAAVIALSAIFEVAIQLAVN